MCHQHFGRDTRCNRIRFFGSTFMSADTWDYHIFWKEAIKHLRGELSEQEFVMWFENIAYHSSREQEIVLSVPSSFYRDQVKQRYLPTIERVLKDLSGTKISIS